VEEEGFEEDDGGPDMEELEELDGFMKEEKREVAGEEEPGDGGA
jgi:hypothetical protein